MVSLGQSPSTWISGAGAIAAAVAVALPTPRATGYREGQTLDRPILARTNFSVADPQLTAELRVRESDRSPNYYRLHEKTLEDLEVRLRQVYAIAKANPGEPTKLIEEARRGLVELDDVAAAELLRLASAPDSTEYAQMIDAIIVSLRPKPLVSREGVAARPAAVRAILFDPGQPQERSLGADQLRFCNDSAVIDQVLTEVIAPASPALRPSLLASVRAILADGAASGDLVRPIYRYDPLHTAEAASAAARNVPLQLRPFAAGDRLADAGTIDAAERALLDAEASALRSAASSWVERWGGPAPLARSQFAILIVAGLTGFMIHLRPQAFRAVWLWTLSAFALTGALALSVVLYGWLELPAEAVVGAQALAVGLLAIGHRSSSVIAAAGSLGLLLTMVTNQSWPFLITLLGVSSVQFAGLRQVRYRGRIVLIGALAALVASGCTAAAGLLERQTLAYVLNQVLWSGGATLAAAFLIEGILPAVERLAGISTGMTLLEHCDANKPLLRLMAAKAPGTYQHSLTVGSLVEAACDAIGADGLLARTGAYYHDIGKINKAGYFVENQAAGVSRHDRLSPAMSVLIIVGHVRDGLEMAREYGLPASLRPFIAEHHGTTLVEYFYHAATKQRKPDDPEVLDARFRYPGPKPQSREAAVLMICDAVEGAVRAMADPGPGRLEQCVSDIVRRRLDDGQFDESELTFRDLAIIESSVVRSLLGIHHARIAYPESESESGVESTKKVS